MYDPFIIFIIIGKSKDPVFIYNCDVIKFLYLWLDQDWRAKDYVSVNLLGQDIFFYEAKRVGNLFKNSPLLKGFFFFPMRHYSNGTVVGIYWIRTMMITPMVMVRSQGHGFNFRLRQYLLI